VIITIAVDTSLDQFTLAKATYWTHSGTYNRRHV